MQTIRPIFGDVAYISPPLDSTPRHGDLLILTAEKHPGSDAIIAAGDDFDGLEKIPVIEDSAGMSSDKYHMLAPRFITHVERDIAELEAVIQKMNVHVSSF